MNLVNKNYLSIGQSIIKSNELSQTYKSKQCSSSKKQFIDRSFNYRNGETKSMVEKMEEQEMKTWAKILCSKDFQKKFSSKKEIDKLSEEDRQNFEELFLMTGLNHIYWRDGIKYEQIFPTVTQVGGTCWANAAATGIVLASKRIIGRKELHFNEVREKLINYFKENVQKNEGVNIEEALSKALPEYNLAYGEVKNEDEINLYNHNGSYNFYICTFWLEPEQWDDFYIFYEQNKGKSIEEAILTKEDLCKTKKDPNRKPESGHAVILLDINSYQYILLNSWGLNWGDQGKFAVERGSIPRMKFYKIYWYESDLTNEEKQCYKRRLEKATEVFYQILDYIQFLYKIEDSDDVQKDVENYLIQLCQDFWRSGTNCTFRRPIKKDIKISQFNNLTLDLQVNIIENLMNLEVTKNTKDFFMIILTFCRNYRTQVYIEILGNKDDNLINIKGGKNVKLSFPAAEVLYRLNLMNEFEHLRFELIYPHPSFYLWYNQIINLINQLRYRVIIGIHIKGIEKIDSFFNDNRNISYIILDSSVSSIGDKAFYRYVSLKEIVIPPSVISIGNGTFYACSSLTQIEIPSSVTSIGNSAFCECSSLKQISIPSSVTSIGNYAFSKCSSLTQITIPSSVTSIGNYTFFQCLSLTQITIPSSVTSIGNYAFSKCSSLAQITIPSSVTSIGDYTFRGCSSLTQITIPSSVTSIGNYAFSKCSSLTQITIPSSVTSIGNYAFSKCSSLTQITILSSINSIGNYTFFKCSSLTQIKIPSSVTSIGNRAFYKCSSLTKIIIPSSVTSIGNYAFSKCSLLTQITIPSSVTSIGDYSFRGCSSLTQITIPSSVTSIGDYSFRECSSLAQIKIPSSVTSIGNYTFRGCSSLTQITIPSSVTSIGNYSFRGCSSLTQITIPSSVTSIGNYSFRGCSSLTKITIPSSVTSIGKSAFKGCSSLTQITIPSSVTSIGKSAFRGCSSLNK